MTITAQQAQAELDRRTSTAQTELNNRAVEERSNSSTLGRGWSDTNDIVRMIASGATWGGSDYIAAAGNTALGNIGSTIAPGWVDDPTFGDEVRKQDVQDKIARARFNSAEYPVSAETIELGSGLIGPGKLIGLKNAGKAALMGGGAYIANRLGNDPLAMYGGYAGLRDLLSRTMKPGRR